MESLSEPRLFGTKKCAFSFLDLLDLGRSWQALPHRGGHGKSGKWFELGERNGKNSWDQREQFVVPGLAGEAQSWLRISEVH